MKYMHIRNHSKDGKLLPHGGFTVAYNINADRTIEFAVAKCSKLDVYNKHRGREIAAGRLLKHKSGTIYLSEAERPVEAVAQAAYMVTNGLRNIPNCRGAYTWQLSLT